MVHSAPRTKKTRPSFVSTNFPFFSSGQRHSSPPHLPHWSGTLSLLIPRLQPPQPIRPRLCSVMSWGDAQLPHFLLILSGSAQILHSSPNFPPPWFLLTLSACMPVSYRSFSRAALPAYSPPYEPSMAPCFPPPPLETHQAHL